MNVGKRQFEHFLNGASVGRHDHGRRRCAGCCKQEHANDNGCQQSPYSKSHGMESVMINREGVGRGVSHSELSISLPVQIVA